ncbi:MAG: hypothetical protein OXB92_12745 [Acidimicrobiaceae bacterium]|nr:hypothetical protein [Acidimicrobiia bacterium]MCY4494716.1 hypothetical protein [Acidimicrobiaceae bacterium]
MTLARLKLLSDQYAFDATPRIDDVGVYHVPFESMSAGTPVERRFRGGALRGERIALIGDSGSGKTSLVSHILGPTAEAVAPVLVPVHSLEHNATKENLIADMIILQLPRLARETGYQIKDNNDSIGEKRQVTRLSRRSRGVSVQSPGWMARAGIAEQIERQTTTTEPNTLVDKIEVIHQCLQPIHGDELMPVFVFDDTDRWTAAAEETIVSGFFGNAIRWLADLQASVVVATHTRYLESTRQNSNLLTFLDTQVELPRIPSIDQLARILQQRVQIHSGHSNGDDPAWQLEDVVEPSAIEELYKQYEQGSSLRTVIQLAHMALVETVDANKDTITSREIQAVVRA